MPTPHINAKPGDFAKVVLMPGDPMRAKWIIENFLHDAVLVTEVRGVFGYTGYTENGKRISVMASGMGMPSIGIYSHELFDHYGVEAIIRIGTCGSYSKEAHVGSVILAQGACTDSNWAYQYNLQGGVYSAISDFGMLQTAYNAAKELKKNVVVGNVLSADVFYDTDPDYWKKWAKLGVVCVEMESYALFGNAAYMGKKALSIFTVSDSFVEEGILTPEQRQTGLKDMVLVALKTAEAYAD